MWTWRCVLIASLAALPLCSSTIIVSGSNSVTLQPGNTLIFTISAYSYEVHAPMFGAPADPSRLSFSLLSGPSSGFWDMSAELTSLDGSVSAPIGNLAENPGFFQGTYYSGPDTSLSGSVQLRFRYFPASCSAGPSVLLVLTDLSGDATFSLPPYTMQQDMLVTLSGGGFSVGGVVAEVQFDPPDPPAGLSGAGMASASSWFCRDSDHQLRFPGTGVIRHGSDRDRAASGVPAAPVCGCATQRARELDACARRHNHRRGNHEDWFRSSPSDSCVQPRPNGGSGQMPH